MWQDGKISEGNFWNVYQRLADKVNAHADELSPQKLQDAEIVDVFSPHAV
jgi:hypothetical protein